MKEKEELRIRKNEKNLKTFEETALQGWSVTAESIRNIEQLNETELLSEVKYLSGGITLSARQFRRISVDGKYKMEKLKAI